MSRTLPRLLSLFVAMVLLAACGGGAAEPPAATDPAAMPGCSPTSGALALAVGGHANGPAPALPPDVEGMLAAAVAVPAGQPGPPVSLIEIDGRPVAVVSGQVFRSDAGNDDALAADRAQFAADVADAVAQTTATTAEVDDLAGLDMAARAVHATGPTGTVVLIDPGLSTVAPLDFRRPGMLAADPADVVAFLRAHHALPDLHGLVVRGYGIGDTAPPQPPLPLAQQAQLRALWSAVLTASGAACVTISSWPHTGAAGSGLPPVGLVPLPSPPVIDLGSGVPTVLADDSAVGFLPGRDVLRDPQGAADLLTPVATWLAGDPARTVTLTGTTARWGDDAGQLDLSLRRARAVASVLVSLGAPADRIHTTGLGSHFPGYRPDNGPAGPLLPEPATHNRSVILTPSGS